MPTTTSGPPSSLSCWEATPQDPHTPPPEKSSSKGNPSLPTIPKPSPPLAPQVFSGPLPRLWLQPHRGEPCPGAQVLQLRWVGGGRAGEREGKQDGSHLHGPLELLTSDRPVEGLEQKHTGGPGSLGPWGAHSVWQRQDGSAAACRLHPDVAALLPRAGSSPCVRAAVHTCSNVRGMCRALCWELETQG